MKTNNCIYIITNLITHKQYVGVAKDFNKRMYQHQIGHDKEKSPIDKSIIKYGGDNFKAEIIDNYTSPEERIEKEIYYITKYDTYNNGYNATIGGDSFPAIDTKGEKNPRAIFTEEDVKAIRKRRMNGERLSDVFEDYKNKTSNIRNSFSSIGLHQSWKYIYPEFEGHYPVIDSSFFATKTKNELNELDLEFLDKFFKGFGPIKYNDIYKTFKTKIDGESFQKICKEIVERLYGNKSTRRYRNANGETDRRIAQYRIELKEEPKLS